MMSDPHINLSIRVSNTIYEIILLRNMITNLDVTLNNTRDSIKGHGDISHKC